MDPTRAGRSAIVLLASGLLMLGGAVAPASATPAREAQNLAALKRTWPTLPAGTQRSTCQLYGTAPDAIISTGVETMMASRRTRRGMSTAAWKRVLIRYYDWACSGPGGTPR